MQNNLKSRRGFTLIEVLTVITLVGILAALAMPQYSQYRKRAFDLRAKSDLRNSAVAEEAYFIDNEHYLSCANQTCTKLPGIRALTGGVTLGISGTASGFVGTASNSKGTLQVFTWNSDAGGMIE